MEDDIPARAKRTAIVYGKWCHPTSGDTDFDFSEEKLQSVMEEVCKDKLGYVSTQIQLSKQNQQTSKLRSTCKYNCFFSSKERGQCKWFARWVREPPNSDKFRIEIPENLGHSDHRESTGIKVQIEIARNSHMLQLKPEQFLYIFLKKMEEENGVQHNAAEVKSIKIHFSKLRAKTYRAHLPSQARATSFASLKQTLDQYTYANLVLGNDFGDNTVFTCASGDGVPYMLQQHPPMEPFIPNDAPKDAKDWVQEARFVAVFSTESLLLNMYRLWYHSENIHFQIDASYRYTIYRRVGYIPITVVSRNQVGHTVAYAIMNKEDEASHTFILQCVKNQVEIVVNRRVALGHQYI